MNKYRDVELFIGGQWTGGAGKKTIRVFNPATGEEIGRVARAEITDLDRALAAVLSGYYEWMRTPAFERARVMQRAANILRDRAEEIALLMTLEQGKPLRESTAETLGAADTIDWFAGEAQRAYGRVIPARSSAVLQNVFREPVGPVAAFTPWNFPINQIVKKLAAALAAGCSLIVKAPEETPASPAALIQAFADAGLPSGVVNLVFGEPAEISSYLIAHPVIRKVTFTGSTAVGKQLAALAGTHMKRATMELGGHAPVIICEDADVQTAVESMVAHKFRNAGQVCASPTRFIVHEDIYPQFVKAFSAAAEKLVVGNGLYPQTTMGPLSNARRVNAVADLVQDAIEQGAVLATGEANSRSGDGHFFGPTVLSDVPVTARVMNEEPFGPIAAVVRYTSITDALAEANRLRYGLAAYAFTNSAYYAHTLATSIRSGMLSINHAGLALPETPFGGVDDSGYGFEGGTEGIDAYLSTKFVSMKTLKKDVSIVQ